MHLGSWELIVVLIVLLLLFGSRLPSIMRSLGRSATEFKRGLNEISDETLTDDKDKGRKQDSQKPSDTTPAG